jgi:hypothetical protein
MPYFNFFSFTATGIFFLFNHHVPAVFTLIFFTSIHVKCWNCPSIMCVICQKLVSPILQQSCLFETISWDNTAYQICCDSTVQGVSKRALQLWKSI